MAENKTKRQKGTARTLADILVTYLNTILAFFGGLLLVGCAHDGHIYVDHPEVFTRERLVNRRLDDLQWLQQQQQNGPVNNGIQGGRLQSQYSAFTGQLSAQFDPLAAAGAIGNLQAIQSAQEANQLQNQLVTTAWQQELQALQNGKISYSQVLGTNTITASASNSNASGAFNATNMAIGMGAPSALASLPIAAALSNLVFVGNNFQTTPIEQFQDRLSYRDAISAEMRERELDDTHDRVGMTLYTLKFDLSVIPGNDNNSHRGQAAVSFNMNDLDYTNLYNQWIQAMRAAFDNDVISIQRRYLEGYLTDDEQRQITIQYWAQSEFDRSELSKLTKLIVSLPNFSPTYNLMSSSTNKLTMSEIQSESFTNYSDFLAFTSKFPSWLLQELDLPVQPTTNDKSLFDPAPILAAASRWTNVLMGEIITNLMDLTNTYSYFSFGLKASSSDSGYVSPAKKSAIMKVLCRLVTFQYEQALGGLVFFGDPKSVATASEDDYEYLVPVAKNPSLRKFTNAVNRITVKATPFVYAVEPKQYAQNLSDASSRQDALNLGLALSGAIPQAATSVSAYMNYVQQNQYLLEAIKREPLIAGFISGDTTFGWILGPRFKIDNKLKLKYEQIPVQESVQATIAVPDWWYSIKINATNDWLNDSAKPYHDSTETSQTFNVRLRPNYDSLTRALLEENDADWPNNPQIHPLWDNDPNKRGYVVQVGSPAHLLILGRNLWRNPKIFIGNQSTTKYDYEVLPDMQGLVANFDFVQPVPTLSGTAAENPKVDLRVVTSDGESVLKDAVTVLSGPGPAASGSFVSLINYFGVANSSFVFAVNTNQAPVQYMDYELYLSTTSSDPVPVSTNSVVQNGQLSFTLPGWATAQPAFIDVKVRLSPLAPPVSVLAGGRQNIVIFTNSLQSQFYITNPNITVAMNNPNATTNVIVALPSSLNDSSGLWETAWPSANGSLAELELVLNGQTNIISATSGINFKGTTSFAVAYNQMASTVTGTNPLTFQAVVRVPTGSPRWRIPAGTLTVSQK